MANLVLRVTKQKFRNGITRQDGYIARSVSNGLVGFDDICKYASANTTMHPKELALAFGLALDAVSDALKQGKIVELEQIGRIYPTVTSKMAETEDGLTLDSVEAKVSFRPAQEIKAAIAGAKLAWATEKEAAKAAQDGTVTDGTTTTGGTTVTDDNSGSEGGGL